MTRNEITKIVEAVVAALEKPKTAIMPQKPITRKTPEERDVELIEFIIREVRDRGNVSKSELLYRSHAKSRDFQRALDVLIERGEITLSAQLLQIGN